MQVELLYDAATLAETWKSHTLPLAPVLCDGRTCFTTGVVQKLKSTTQDFLRNSNLLLLHPTTSQKTCLSISYTSTYRQAEVVKEASQAWLF